MYRLFWGLDLSPETQTVVYNLGNPIAEVQGCKREASEKLHATLLFLGEVTSTELKTLVELSKNLKMDSALEATVTGIGCFNNSRPGGVIWAGFTKNPETDKIMAEVEKVTTEAGIPFNKKSFKPHITLFRCRTATEEPLKLLKKEEFQPFPVVFPSFSLYSSELLPGGSVYKKELTVTALPK